MSYNQYNSAFPVNAPQSRIDTGGNTMVKYGVFIIFAIFWILLTQYLIQKFSAYNTSNHKIIDTWWKLNDGDKFKEIFTIDLLNEFSKPYWIYLIDNLFKTTNTKMLNNYDSISFLNQYIIPHIYLSGSGTLNQNLIHQFVYPRHLCNSILFIKGEDYYFDKLLKQGTFKYPSTSNITAWINLIIKWSGNYLVHKQQDKQTGKLLIFEPDPDTKNKNEWFDFERHADNVFARYYIPYDSPFITSLCNKLYTASVSGVKLNNSACVSLLGEDSIGQNVIGNKYPGGWIEFLHKLEKDNTEPADFLYTSINTNAKELPKDTSHKCDGADTTNNIMSGIGSGVGIAAMAMFIPGAGEAELAFNTVRVGQALFALAGIGVGAAQIAEKEDKCK